MDNKASNVKGIPFGKRLRCGNFYVEKVSRALSKADMKALRAEMVSRMPKGYKCGQRASMPVIRVCDMQGMWRVEYSVASAMFHVFDAFEWDCFDGECFIKDDTCKRLITMLFCDTTVLGDAEYVQDRVKALNGFTQRVKAPYVDDDADNGTLEVLQALDMLKNDDGDGQRKEGK